MLLAVAGPGCGVQTPHVLRHGLYTSIAPSRPQMPLAAAHEAKPLPSTAFWNVGSSSPSSAHTRFGLAVATSATPVLAVLPGG